MMGVGTLQVSFALDRCGNCNDFSYIETDVSLCLDIDQKCQSLS